MDVTFRPEITLMVITCCNCGVIFGMGVASHTRFVRDKSLEFFCPNGHPQHFLGESWHETEVRLRLELEGAKKQLAACEAKLQEKVSTKKRKA